MSEFNLSEKIVEGEYITFGIEDEDVKEFIRLLKERIEITTNLHRIKSDEIRARLLQEIDLFAGEDLK